LFTNRVRLQERNTREEAVRNEHPLNAIGNFEGVVIGKYFPIVLRADLAG